MEKRKQNLLKFLELERNDERLFDRIEILDKKLEMIDKRVDRLENTLNDVRRDVNDVRTDLKDEIRIVNSKIDNNLKWTIGIGVTLIIAMIVNILI